MSELALLLAMLAAGAWLVAVLDRATVEGASVRALAFPVRRLALHLLRQSTRTERPDLPAWKLAPAAYLALAFCGLAVVPLGPGRVVAATPAGIVLWGAVESLVVVAVFLHGWSANSPLPLVAGYRYVASGLVAMLVSMFVLIAAALPAESLALGAVVESQRELWNVLRHPLGLPLFAILGLSVSLRGPLNFGDSADLCDGTAAEVSGVSSAVWQAARTGMLVAFSAMAATVFLGGYLGPVLPGPVWLALKTAVVLVVMVLIGHRIARWDPGRFLTLAWVVLLPLSFLHLAIAGLVAL